MTFQILGPVRLRNNAGAEDPLGGTKPRTVLATLLLAQGAVVTDRHLGSMLWGTRPPVTAAAQIHTYASRLRARLAALGPEGIGGGLHRSGHGYRLLVEPALVDHHEFQRLSRGGLRAQRVGDHLAAAARLREALGHWQGDEPLVDVTDQLAGSECLALEERRLEVLEARIESDLILGRQRQLVPELAALVARHPMRETFRAQQMTALYRVARQADAIALYQEGRRILARELGVDPSPLLARTYQNVLTGEWRGPVLSAAS